MIRKAKALSEIGFKKLERFLPGQTAFEKLQRRTQLEILRLLSLGPQLMDQIGFWLECGKVAQDKIISLWKLIPKAIPKGKIGKPVEFGRKWIVNAYHGGYVLVTAPENPKIADQNCVIESLSLHQRVFDKMPASYGTDRGMYSTGPPEAFEPKGRSRSSHAI